MASRYQSIGALARVIVEASARAKTKEQQELVSDAVARWIIKAGLRKKLPEILRQYERYQRERDGIQTVSITTARPWSDSVRQRIEQHISHIFGADRVIAQWQEDPSVVGGIRAQTDTMRLSATIADLLHQL